MPRYDFQCPICEHILTLATLSAGVDPVCPAHRVVLQKIPHYQTVQVQIPAGWHTDLHEVVPNAQARVRQGELIPANAYGEPR